MARPGDDEQGQAIDQDFLKREQQNNIERGMATLTERLAKLNIKPFGTCTAQVGSGIRCATKEEFLQQNRCRHHPAGRYREASESQLGEQDPEILDAVHPQKGEAGERGRRDAAIDEAADDTSPDSSSPSAANPFRATRSWDSAIRSRARSSSTRPPARS